MPVAQQKCNNPHGTENSWTSVKQQQLIPVRLDLSKHAISVSHCGWWRSHAHFTQGGGGVWSKEETQSLFECWDLLKLTIKDSQILIIVLHLWITDIKLNASRVIVAGFTTATEEWLSVISWCLFACSEENQSAHPKFTEPLFSFTGSWTLRLRRCYMSFLI